MLILHIPGRLSPRTGFTLIEVVTSLMILAVLAVMLVPLATTLLDSQRASNTEADLNKVYTAIVGDQSKVPMATWGMWAPFRRASWIWFSPPV